MTVPAPRGRPVSTTLPVGAQVAFRLLEDPTSFERLVAGARRIRRFDARWPEPGTRLHHTVGVPPLVVRDYTEVLELDAPRHLVLAAHVRPLGTLTVDFRLDDDPKGCQLTVTEWPESGPISWPFAATVTTAAVVLRNMEICRRFRRMVGERAGKGTDGAGG